MTSPSLCCEHPASEHALIGVCQVVVHYPDEDAPCLCDGFKQARGGECASCSHAGTAHAQIVLCRPGSNGFCSCARPLQEAGRY